MTNHEKHSAPHLPPARDHVLGKCIGQTDGRLVCVQRHSALLFNDAMSQRVVGKLRQLSVVLKKVSGTGHPPKHPPCTNVKNADRGWDGPREAVVSMMGPMFFKSRSTGPRSSRPM